MEGERDGKGMGGEDTRGDDRERGQEGRKGDWGKGAGKGR